MEKRYGMFGQTEAQLRAHGITLLPHEGRAVIDALQPEQIRTVPLEHFPLMTQIEIFYDGRWRQVYREDLFRQVATTRQQSLQEYRDTCNYGVRVTDDGFCIVDCLTDG